MHSFPCWRSAGLGVTGLLGTCWEVFIHTMISSPSPVVVRSAKEGCAISLATPRVEYILMCVTLSDLTSELLKRHFPMDRALLTMQKGSSRNVRSLSLGLLGQGGSLLTIALGKLRLVVLANHIELNSAHPFSLKVPESCLFLGSSFAKGATFRSDVFLQWKVNSTVQPTRKQTVAGGY